MGSLHQHDLSLWVRHDRARHELHPPGGEHADEVVVGFAVAEGKTR